MTLELAPEAAKVLIDKGFDPVFGARPLKRTLRRYIENALSEDILSGKFREGDKILADLKGELITFSKGS